MRLEIEPNTTAVPFSDGVVSHASSNGNASEAMNALQEGIKAAQSGNRPQARAWLLRATEIDPKCENGWLWLASISEYPEELLVFLSNVLEINPANERALEWTAATKSLLSKTFVQRGIDAFQENQAEYAAQCFNKALEYDEQNGMAWLWMASLADSAEGKIVYLEKVLSIDPENDAAQSAFQSARQSISQSQLAEVKSAAVAGRTSEANELLDVMLKEAPDSEEAWILRSHLVDRFDEKISSLEKALEINPENVAARASLDSIRSIVESFTPVVSANDVGSDEECAVSTVDENQPDSVDDDLKAVPFETPVSDSVAVEPDVKDEEVFADSNEHLNVVENETESSFDVSDETLTVDSTQSPWETKAEDVAEVSVNDPNYSFTNEAPPDFLGSVPAPVEDLFEETCYVPVSPNVGETSVVSEEPVKEDRQNGNGLNTETQVFTLSSLNLDNLASAGNGEPAVFEVAEEITNEVPVSVISEVSNSSEVFAGIGIDSRPEFMPAVTEIPMPSAAFDDGVPEHQPTGYETYVVPIQNSNNGSKSTLACPFCKSENEVQAVVCGSCMAVLTLSDLEMLLAHQHADKMILRQTVENMEREKSSRPFTENELTMLGIGHLNLRNLHSGYTYLREASQLNPNNVVLSSQVNALNIRLDEIKRQEEVQDSMPKGKTILVVDDSATVRKLIAGKLEKSGHAVFCSSDGVEAMERMQDLAPDLILLDITMPRMDGYQVCKLIRSNPATKDVPVVMISGKDGFFDKVRGRMAGTTGYITKPFGPETLMKAVETYLKGDVQDVEM